MSRPTKLKALDKLARLRVKIAYPDKWLDYSALELRSDDLVGDVLASSKFDWRRQVERLNFAGRPRRMDDESADRECVLRQ